MTQWVIEGNQPLQGTVEVAGSKNAILPILCASILATEDVILENVPDLTDVLYLLEIISSLNVGVDWDRKNQTVTIRPQQLQNKTVDAYAASKLRASFLIAGSLLGKFSTVEFPMPGGCSIGQRPIDLHLKVFESFNAGWEIKHGEVFIKGKLKPGTIFLDFPSVGATQNAILTAVSIKGTTTILNAAEEPEIYDLVNFLNELGAKIEKGNGKTWIIKGGYELKGVRYRVMQDRIEAGTWLILSHLTNGAVKVKNVDYTSLDNVITKLTQSGFHVDQEEGVLQLQHASSLSFQTGPQPSFPTDMQPQISLLCTTIPGTHVIVETVFENRFQHVPELIKMGANIKVLDNRIALIYGDTSLTGARIQGTDLRAGATLLMAALTAKGTSHLEGIHHIERGYHNILHRLVALGAQITVQNSK